MVIYAWRRDFVLLLRRFIRQFAISFHAFLGMTFRVIGPRLSQIKVFQKNFPPGIGIANFFLRAFSWYV